MIQKKTGAREESTELHLAVDSILFSGEGEEGREWLVVRASRIEDQAKLTVVGRMPPLEEGLEIRVKGSWMVHPRHGRQFQARETEILPPSTRRGVTKYLASGDVKGVGPKLAARIVDHLGEEALNLIERNPRVLRKVPGIGPAKAEAVAEAIRSRARSRAAMVFLRGLGLGEAMARKVYQAHGSETVAAIRANPYRLTREIFGLGFKRADTLARALEIPRESPFRLQAGVIHTLREAAREGHTFLPLAELCRQAGELLGAEPEPVEEQLVNLTRQGEITVLSGPCPEELGPAVYPALLARAEEEAAGQVKQILASLPTSTPPRRLLAAMTEERTRSGLCLEGEQLRALELALTAPISVVTGGPGVGKTSLVKVLAGGLRRGGARVLLAAPTGRAARRLAEVTGMEAATIHRTLKYNPHRGHFEHDRRNPLPADLVVVDETSMVDIQLAASLLKALGGQTRLVMVGDADQLPSVGPGNVLRDLIATGRIPLTRLTRIFRRRGRSLITRNAHRLLQGQTPELGNDREGDFFFIEEEDPGRVRELIVGLVAERLPRAYGLDPVDQIQVLAPMYRGEAGADRLNEELQARLVPEGPELHRGPYRFRRGDKVLQIKNDYDRELFNGDVGRVLEVNPGRSTMAIDFEGRRVECDKAELDQVIPAFAMSVHRSQGSEFPAVVIPLVTQHYMMLRRNLFYTALTRAKRLVVLVGSRRALELAVSRDDTRTRWSGLQWRICSGS